MPDVDISQLRNLLQYLNGLYAPYSEHGWQDWQIRPVPSGNNLIFRVTRTADDWAIKFTIRDKRERAQREFNALRSLESLNISVAPRPIYFDQEQFRLPVVVQSWIDGAPLDSPPEDDSVWTRVLVTYHQIHTATATTLENRGITMPHCGLVTQWPEKAINGLHEFLTQIPEPKQPPLLIELLAELERTALPAIRVTSCLCHGDATVRNILQTANGIALVDWEYSGVSDPAHEVAMLMAHPHVQAVSEAQCQWLAERYAHIAGDAEYRQRIQVQYALALIWWCIRLVYGRCVLLQKPTHRLVGPAPEAEISSTDNIEHYLSRARDQLRRVGNA